MPDFNKIFTVDSNASGAGFGTVLHQGARSLAFFNRLFLAHHLNLTAYERELIGLVQAVRHWRPTYGGAIFFFILTITASTSCWTNAYRRCLNTSGLANSSSSASPWSIARAAPEADGTTAAAALSGSSFAYLDDVRSATTAAPDTHLLLERLRAGELAAPWREDAGLLLHGTRIFVLDFGDLCHQALQLAHGASHKGVQKTLHRLCSDFYIPGDCSMVQH
jgi:hypothetical protein